MVFVSATSTDPSIGPAGDRDETNVLPNNSLHSWPSYRRNPEISKFHGFRVALAIASLPGMTFGITL
jgi:hypothetical protein